MITTIQLRENVKNELDKLKTNKETYEEVILYLMKTLEQNKRQKKELLIEGCKEMAKESAWSKIQTLVKNKDIQIIECPGPDKPILIHEKGSLAKISLSMSEEEIINLLKTIAQENAVPFAHGVMKIKSQNYSLTAVVSEFAGSRFIIYNNSYNYG